MNGLILSDCGSVCSCGGAFKTIFNEIIKAKYPACDKCQKPPSLLRVKKSFPGKDGKVYYAWFRDNLQGNRLDSVSDCIELIGQLNKEITDPSFKLEKYNSKARECMSVENVLNEYLAHADKRFTLPQRHRLRLTKGGRRTLVSNVKNHLLPYFKERLNSKGETVTRYIDEIDKKEIIKFYDSYVRHFRARDKATGELKALLNFAKDELEYIKEVPPFPYIPRARSLTREEIPDEDTQLTIVRAIEDEFYREVWIIVASTASRPCEIIVLLAKDYNPETRELTISRHRSDGEIEEGRKSIQGHEELGVITHTVDDEAHRILVKHIEGKGPEDPIFPGRLSKFIGDTTLRKHMKMACLKLGFMYRPYAVAKHSTLNKFVEEHGYEKGVQFSKHSDIKTLKIYVKPKVKDDGFVNSNRFALGGAKKVQDEFDNVVSLSNYR
nr:hypothetical protein BHI3_07870 [Bacteriovorax sp. HI3]